MILLQDFTGVPAVVDLACMRDAMNKLGSDSDKINPLVCGVLILRFTMLLNLPCQGHSFICLSILF